MLPLKQNLFKPKGYPNPKMTQTNPHENAKELINEAADKLNLSY